MNKLYYFAGLLMTAALLSGSPDHLVFSELVLQPNDGAYIKIANPTGVPVDLSNYYITDGTNPGSGIFYYNLPDSSNYWAGDPFDFLLRFPDGYSIAAGASIIIGVNDSITYNNEYGNHPDLTLKESFRPAYPGESTAPLAPFNILDTSAETLVLFYWDGSAAVVQDVDYLLWGNNSLAVDKSSVPGYQPDTPAASQSFMPIHVSGEKLVRSDDEGDETAANGNGITGHDETSENLAVTWQILSLTSNKPVIVSFTASPAEPVVGDQLSFSADVTDDGILSSVELISIFDGETSIDAMTSSGGDNYSLTLSTLETAGDLQWKIRATDDTGLADSTAWQLTTIGSGAPDIQSAVISPSNPEMDNILSFTAVVVDNESISSVELLHQFEDGAVLAETMTNTEGDVYSATLDPVNSEGVFKWKIRATDNDGLQDSTGWKTVNITDPSANIIPFSEILTGNYLGQTVVIQGLLVDYFDVTVYNGPHSLTLEDDDGYQLECTIWPGDWDIPNSPQAFLVQPPFGKYVIRATGSVDIYEGNYQIGVTSFDDFDIVKIYGCPDPTAQTNEYGDCIYPGEFTEAAISPAPFVLIPALGEHLDYEYSFPANSRVIVRVFDLTGRFITSLVDEFYPESGQVVRDEDWAGWDGRDHLGQVVAPGTYFMHIEATDFKSGKTSTDIAPVVVGVKF